MKAKVLLIAAVLFSGALVFGQGGYKGSIAAEITTEDGSALPGAVALLTADTFSRSFVSDANGNVRFVGLLPDRYELRVSFTGFNTYVRPNIVVDTGQNVRLTVTMTPSTQQEEIVVTAESPLMDTTKTGTQTVLTEEELNAVPQSRDPWSVIMTVPGIQTDRVNVGGSEAGQQSNFASKGDNGDNASWTMDGVEFTDPGARGASQSYLDFSSFSQMGVTTGGADASQRSGGAAMNFVTKQGSNNHQGSVRLLYADQDFQSSHSGLLDSNGDPRKGNRISETFEKAFEIGGPLIKDRLWYWGSFSQNSVTNLTINDIEDRTELRNISFKLHGDITSSLRFNAYYTEGDKVKNGRGAGPNRPINTTWDQAGPTPIYKFELSQVIGQNTELRLLAARVDGGFGLTPRGKEGQISLDNSTGVWENSTFFGYSTKRPVRQYQLDGDTFLTTGNIDHELKYGFQYKEATVQSLSTYGDEGLFNIFGPESWGGFGVAYLYREGNAASALESMSFHVGDTMTMGNWTFKAGLRWDRQEGRNIASTVNAHPIIPELLPAVSYTGGETPFTWNTIAPRLGATYSFGDDNQYLVRGSVAKFYDTLSSGFITPNNPTNPRYVYYYWYDGENGDGLVQMDETVEVSSNVDQVLTQIDPDLESPEQDELILGFEWSINPEFTVGITGTWRKKDNFTWAPINGLSTSDYVLNEGTQDVVGNDFHDVPVEPGTTYSYYSVRDDWEPADANGDGNNDLNDIQSYFTNNPFYSEDYSGIELTATKRLSNRWMMRANVTFQDWTRNVDPNGIINPTNFRSGSNEDGATRGVQSAGSGNRANVFFGSAGWTFNVNGLYQLPWDVTVSANLNGREGFAAPFSWRQRYNDPLGSNTVFVKPGKFDDFRFEDLFTADFKVAKTFHMGGRTKVEVAAEIFNAFNEDTVLARELRLDTTRAGTPAEVLSPRVGRFSATVHF